MSNIDARKKQINDTLSENGIIPFDQQVNIFACLLEDGEEFEFHFTDFQTWDSFIFTSRRLIKITHNQEVNNWFTNDNINNNWQEQLEQVETTIYSIEAIQSIEVSPHPLRQVLITVSVSDDSELVITVENYNSQIQNSIHWKNKLQ